MWECKILFDLFQCLPHLTQTARFVDRDMFMHFLGYGIGHKDQNKYVGLMNEAGNQDDLEEDSFDLQNMARIASSKYVPPASSVATNRDAGTQDGDDDPSAEDSDMGSDDDDLNGNF